MSADPLGNRLLIGGIAAYAAALAISAAFSAKAFGILFIALIFWALIPFLAFAFFCIGTVTGTPLVSFSHALSAMRRAWRSLIGAYLLAFVLIALLRALL